MSARCGALICFRKVRLLFKHKSKLHGFCRVEVVREVDLCFVLSFDVLNFSFLPLSKRVGEWIKIWF
jgi:hypothetical protein